VIHGCLKSNGDIGVIDTSAGATCRANETPLNWDQTGPAGATGATGQAGQNGQPGQTGATAGTGPQGLPGPSDGYYNAASGPIDLPANTFTTIVGLHLPAGSYLLSAKVTIQGTDPAGTLHLVNCYIMRSGDGSERSTSEVRFDTTISDLAWATLSVPTDFTYQCNPGTGTDRAWDAVITAVQVGALHLAPTP
jgi:hypothetical protein